MPLQQDALGLQGDSANVIHAMLTIGSHGTDGEGSIFTKDLLPTVVPDEDTLRDVLYDLMATTRTVSTERGFAAFSILNSYKLISEGTILKYHFNSGYLKWLASQA